MNRTGLLICLICFTFVIFLAPKIDMYYYDSPAGQLESEVPFYMQFLGEGRSILSNLSILQADRYFHGGIGHIDEDHPGGITIDGESQEEEGRIHEEEHPEKIHRAPGRFNILLRISEKTEITRHIHLSGNQVKEIIPWIYYSAKIDPHNVLAYTLAGYWLADRLDKVDEAIAFVKEGLKNNPDSWELNAELGRLYFKHRKDYKAAARVLTRALQLLQGEPHDKFQERYVLSFLAYSYEDIGEKAKVLPLYQRLGQLFPEDGGIKRKIRKLQEE